MIRLRQIINFLLFKDDSYVNRGEKIEAFYATQKVEDPIIEIVEELKEVEEPIIEIVEEPKINYIGSISKNLEEILLEISDEVSSIILSKFRKGELIGKGSLDFDTFSKIKLDGVSISLFDFLKENGITETKNTEFIKKYNIETIRKETEILSKIEEERKERKRKEKEEKEERKRKEKEEYERQQRILEEKFKPLVDIGLSCSSPIYDTQGNIVKVDLTYSYDGYDFNFHFANGVYGYNGLEDNMGQLHIEGLYEYYKYKDVITIEEYIALKSKQYKEYFKEMDEKEVISLVKLFKSNKISYSYYYNPYD